MESTNPRSENQCTDKGCYTTENVHESTTGKVLQKNNTSFIFINKRTLYNQALHYQYII